MATPYRTWTDTPEGPDFKSGVSTNFTKGARDKRKFYNVLFTVVTIPAIVLNRNSAEIGPFIAVALNVSFSCNVITPESLNFM